MVDFKANEAYYRLRGGHPADVLTLGGPLVPPMAARLKGEIALMSRPPVPPPVVVPLPPPRRQPAVIVVPPPPPPPVPPPPID